MKKFFLTSLISVGLALTASANEPTAATAPAMMEATKATENPAHSSKKMTKEERLAHSTKEVEGLMASVTEKAKSLTGADKKMADLYIAHAQLEIDAAKDADMKSHTSSHINKARRFLKQGAKFTAKGAVQDKKSPEVKAEVKAKETAEPTTKK